MITESEIPRAEMLRAADAGYLCAECQGRLVVAWGGAYNHNGWILRCGNSYQHKGVTRHDVKYETKIREGLSMDSTALTKLDEKQMAARIDMAKFPQDLTVADKRLLTQVAISYGFDPLMKEVSIYQGNAYVSIDGRYRKAQESGKLDGVATRPATEQERMEWGIPAGDYFFRAEVRVTGAAFPFVGWGRVFEREVSGGKGFKPVETNPQRMAEKRAEAQALRKAFHIPLPSLEDIGLLPDVPPAVKVEEVKSPAVLDALLPPAPARNPAFVQTINQLKTALWQDFRLRESDQLRELNIKQWSELAISPADAYKKVAATYEVKDG